MAYPRQPYGAVLGGDIVGLAMWRTTGTVNGKVRPMIAWAHISFGLRVEIMRYDVYGKLSDWTGFTRVFSTHDAEIKTVHYLDYATVMSNPGTMQHDIMDTINGGVHLDWNSLGDQITNCLALGEFEPGKQLARPTAETAPESFKGISYSSVLDVVGTTKSGKPGGPWEAQVVVRFGYDGPIEKRTDKNVITWYYPIIEEIELETITE